MIITHNHYHIVYADTVLPLKEKGENIHVASLSNIEPYELERCIDTITKANPNVSFNTIQYSQNNKKIYFYSDQPISVGAWKKINTTHYEGVSNADKIIDSIKQILESDTNLNTGYISAFDLSCILYNINSKDENFKGILKSKLDMDIDYNISEDASILIYGFDYDKEELKVGFKRHKSSKWEDITFNKAHGDLRIVEAQSIYAPQVLSACHKHLSEYYDYCMSTKDYNNEWAHNVRSLDGFMKATISHCGITLRDCTYINSRLEIDSRSYLEKYEVKCNSSKVLEALSNNKRNLLKKIYVKIDDCPSWCKKEVLDFRINQVKTEIKKIRKNEFWGKFNPFKKKKRSK